MGEALPFLSERVYMQICASRVSFIFSAAAHPLSAALTRSLPWQLTSHHCCPLPTEGLRAGHPVKG